MNPRDLQITNKHGLFQGHIDHVERILMHYPNLQLMYARLHESCPEIDFTDVKSVLELSIIIADISSDGDV